jgi:hypothetical protein
MEQDSIAHCFISGFIWSKAKGVTVCQTDFFLSNATHHMSLMDFVVSASGCGRSVTDFRGLDAPEVQLRCHDEVDGDI